MSAAEGGSAKEKGTHPQIARQSDDIRLVDLGHVRQRRGEMAHVARVDALLDQIRCFALERLVQLEVASNFLRAVHAAEERSARLSTWPGGRRREEGKESETHLQATIIVYSLTMHTLVSSRMAA